MDRLPDRPGRAGWRLLCRPAAALQLHARRQGAADQRARQAGAARHRDGRTDRHSLHHAGEAGTGAADARAAKGRDGPGARARGAGSAPVARWQARRVHRAGRPLCAGSGRRRRAAAHRRDRRLPAQLVARRPHDRLCPLDRDRGRPYLVGAGERRHAAPADANPCLLYRAGLHSRWRQHRRPAREPA